MFQMNKLSPAGLLFLISLLIVAATHLVVGDYPLFHSDLWSLSIYLGAAALFVSGLLAVLVAPAFYLLGRHRQRVYELLLATLVAVLGASTLRIVLSMLTSRKIDPWATLICLGVAAWLVRRQPRDLLLGKARQLTCVCGAIGFGLLPLMLAWNVWLAPRVAAQPAAKRIVLIVLDGMPQDEIHTYNSQAVRGPLDDLLAESHVFTNMRTVRPFTFGYFGTLYTGETLPLFDEVEQSHWHRLSARHVSAQGPTFLSTLDQHGIPSRLFCFHRNGMPESSAAQISDYPGLRSVFLTENYTWLPRLLNIHFHAMLYSPNTLPEGCGARLYRGLNQSQHAKLGNVFNDILLPELRLWSPQEAFALFHVSWHQAARGNLHDGVDRTAWAQAATASSDDVLKQIRGNEYRYNPELEPVAELQRQRNAADMQLVGHHLAEFVRQLRTDPRLQNTLVILTADHGNMSARGRFWYGYHPCDEVVRVPLAVVNGASRRVDARLFSTADLPATILEYLGLPDEASKLGHSILGDSAGREFTATLTMQAPNHREWFLVLQQGDRTYEANLHAEGNGATFVTRSEDRHVIARSYGPPPEVRESLQQAIESFGVSRTLVHPAFNSNAAAAEMVDQPTGTQRR